MTTTNNLTTDAITSTTTDAAATTTTDPTTGAITTTSTDATTGEATTTISNAAVGVSTVQSSDPINGSTTTTTTDLLEDPLHGYCSSGCIDNGTNSPTLQNPITGFGFTISPSPTPVTGLDLQVDILVPYTSGVTTKTSYAISGSGMYKTTPVSFTNLPANLEGTTWTSKKGATWTSGDLASYLGNTNASPNNPIGAYLPSTLNFDPTAIGYYVYKADLGAITLQSASKPNSSPLLSLADMLPLGSYIVGFLNVGTKSTPSWVATANSGAIYEGPEIDAASGSAAIALLLGVLALVSERRRGQGPQIGRG